MLPDPIGVVGQRLVDLRQVLAGGAVELVEPQLDPEKADGYGQAEEYGGCSWQPRHARHDPHQRESRRERQRHRDQSVLHLCYFLPR